MKEIIILLGVPGSGKGSQAKLLSKRMGYVHLSTGDLLRDLAQNPDATEKQKQQLSAMQSGDLVPDDLIYSLAFTCITQSRNQGKGVVLDGAIRNIEQAKTYTEFFKEQGITDIIAIEIAVDDMLSLLRLTKRKSCADCGKIIPYHKDNDKLTTCVDCGGPLVVRQDDNPKIINERIKKQGNSALKPLTEYYKNNGLLTVIDGEGDIEDIYKEVQKIIR